MTGCRRFQGLHREGVTFEEDGAEDENLQGALSDDVLPHVGGDQVLEPGVGLALKELVTGGLGSKGERGECVHDEVHPEHLDG